jgi:SAM-dependent methyltransferase
MAAEPPITTRFIERCVSCGESVFRPLAMRYEHLGASFPLVACVRCGLRFLSVQPAPESLGRLYQAEYFESDYRCGREAGSSFDESALAAEDRGLLDRFEALGPGRRLLDVGCAAGWLLRHAEARGWSARGVELSESAARFARERGLDVFQGELAAARLPEGAFDLVYLGDVLEHVPDCRATLEEAARVLAPGGHLYLRGPITTNSLARALGLALYGAFGRAIVLREPPYHLWEFTPGPLRRLFQAAGLHVLRMEQSKIPPGRAHGAKTPLQRAVMAAIDTVNLPLTALLGVWGDRVTVIARRVQAGASEGR